MAHPLPTTFDFSCRRACCAGASIRVLSKALYALSMLYLGAEPLPPSVRELVARHPWPGLKTVVAVDRRNQKMVARGRGAPTRR